MVELTQFKQHYVGDLLRSIQRIWHLQVLATDFIRRRHESLSTELQWDQLEYFGDRRSKSVIDRQIRSRSEAMKNANFRSSNLIIGHSENVTPTKTRRDNLLSIESMQKQLELEYEKWRIHLIRYKICYGWQLKLSDGIPLSEILTDDHWQSFHRKAGKLCKKYIEQGAESEVNLSYNTRCVITNYFNSKAGNVLLSNHRNGGVSTPNFKSVSDTMSVDTQSTHNTFKSHQHSQDDLSRYHRRGSCHSIIDERLCSLKKSRSFHNVFEADLEEEEEANLDDFDDQDTNSVGANSRRSHKRHKCQVQPHDVTAARAILDKLDESAYLLQIFDDAAEEIYSVLRRDSLHRFYQTPMYSDRFLTSYRRKVQKGEIKPYMHHEDRSGDSLNDVELVLYYFCKCKTSKKKQSRCQCQAEYAQREELEVKIKRLKKKGMKRKKPAWIRPVKSKASQKAKSETPTPQKTKFKRRAFDYPEVRENDLTEDRDRFDPSSNEKSKLLSPVTISRRSTKRSSLPYRYTDDSKENYRSRQQGRWKLDTRTADTEHIGEGQPQHVVEEHVVRIVNVNLSHKAHPHHHHHSKPKQKQKRHKLHVVPIALSGASSHPIPPRALSATPFADDDDAFYDDSECEYSQNTMKAMTESLRCRTEEFNT